MLDGHVFVHMNGVTHLNANSILKTLQHTQDLRAYSRPYSILKTLETRTLHGLNFTIQLYWLMYTFKHVVSNVYFLQNLMYSASAYSMTLKVIKYKRQLHIFTHI